MTSTPQSEALVVSRARPARLRAAFGRLDLLAPVRCSGLEAALAAAYLFAVAFAVYGVQIARGGFMLDDWTIAYDVRRTLDTHGVFGAFSELMNGTLLSGNFSGRPTEAAVDLALFGTLGEHAALHLARAIVVAALVSFLAYVVLRWLRLERLHAGTIATVLLLFPAADSTVLWITADVAHATLVFYLLGTICALRGLRANGRAAIAFHAAGSLLYAASILQYQIAGPLVFLSVLVYRIAGAPWRRAIVPWIGDAVAGLAAVVYVKTHLGRSTGSVSDSFQHARNLLGGARQVFASLGVQNGPERLPTVAMLGLLLAAGAVALLLPGADVVRRELRRWLFIAVAGLVAFFAAYTIFIPGDFFYWPLQPGIGNRVNAAAGIGFAIAVYALAVLVALLVVRALRVKAPATAASAIAVAAMAALSFAFVWTIHSDRETYERATSIRNHALSVMRNDVGRPAPGTTLYLFGIEGEVSTNVFTFVRAEDLTAALRLMWDDDTINGVPAASARSDWPGNSAENSGISCSQQSVKPRGWLFEKFTPTRYGETLFVDVPTRTSKVIRTQAECQAAVSRYLEPA